MLRVALLGLLVTTLVPVLAAQVPFKQEEQRFCLDDEEWHLEELPHPNATDHLVFETVYSFLQHWPNTRMRNGHNIVPGIIPKGTVLYHGRKNNELPTRPDWLATDPEHSYLFCWDLFNNNCWHLTLTTTRPLKIVYFDGTSAAKLPNGTLDTQDLIAWGRTDPHEIRNDWRRIDDLCKWANKVGVDGIVRMEMDFEVMHCDFSSGLSVVSAENLASQDSLQQGLWASALMFEVMSAGSWHNRFPGETRFQLDLAGFVSFYDTQLVPSLVDIRAGQERWDHRVQNISSKDLAAVKSKLEATLANPESPSSGIDWKTLIQVIVDRYARRLEVTRYLLNSTVSEPHEIIDIVNKTQSQLRIMLTPYLLLSATPNEQADKDDLDWTIPVYKLCATTHTRALESELGSMTSSEKLLLRAVRGTTREICRVVTKMWASGVHAGIDRSLNTKESLNTVELTDLLDTWREELERLMGWLDWGVWIKCNPECEPNEMCFLPTWPVGFPSFGRYDGPPPPRNPDISERRTRSDLRAWIMESYSNETGGIFDPDPNAWIRPQPRCVHRIDPYD